MPTPAELKHKNALAQKKHYIELVKNDPSYKSKFLRKKGTSTYLAWTPTLACRDDFELVDEIPAALSGNGQLKTSGTQDRYGLLKYEDLVALCETRGINVGNTKKEDTIRKKLRKWDEAQNDLGADNDDSGSNAD